MASGQPGMLFWTRASAAERQEASERLTTIVHDHAEELVETFYSTFLGHEEASAFLSHSVVSERLNPSLRNWLLELVRFNPDNDLSAFDTRQVQIGEIHARLKIPNHLVMAGLTLLKTEISTKVAALDVEPRSAAHTIILLGELIDYAMRLMTTAYVSDTTRRVQTDEAFRLFSLGQDINLERETQRAALMEWSQSVLFGLLDHGATTPPSALSASPFGLWVRHRASILFQGSALLGRIEALMAEVDSEVLSAVSENQPEAVAGLRRRIDEVKFLLNDLFQTATDMESGRDPLTRTLNRRFLPSVLGREITMAKSAKTPLSLLMADIDHFKSINDAHGHSAGDIVLSHTAEVLLNTVRTSDFVFRYGGEEFLIVLVETDRNAARDIAERIRQQVEASVIAMSDRTQLSVTLSIGLASYEGHPDYQYLINKADKALYRAKNDGRNRVAAAVAA